MGGGIVAVVDDSSAIRNLMRTLLGAAGYEVHAYASPYSLLDDCDIPPDCLIVDQKMPDMTGLELVARLREAGSTIPVLLISGLPASEFTERAADLDIDLVLEKPLEIEVLLQFAAEHC